jgi:spermidine/putrescine transport system substrate-binding protein
MIKVCNIQKISYRMAIIIFFMVVAAFVLYAPKISELLFAPRNILYVYSFTDMISGHTLQAFKKKTGITVKLKYFDSNDELLSQFEINKGAGYDLITVSDFAIKILKKQGYLQNIDTKKLSNFKQLDPRFLYQSYDQKNEYSIPLVWSTYGILYKKSLFDPILKKLSQQMNWSFVFQNPKRYKSEINYKICMIDTPRDAIFLAAIYLFGNKNMLQQEQLEKIKKVLMEQKEWVEVYMLGSLQYYLLGDVVPLAVCDSASAQRMFEESDEFDFVVPVHGSIFSIENLAIPALSKKAEMVHQFIDFLISKEVCLHNSLLYGYNPSNKESYVGIDKKFTENKNFFPDDDLFKRLHLVVNSITQESVEDIWNSVRFS